MYERHSRFDTRPGDIKIPPREAYPSKPVPLQTRWLVQMVLEGDLWLKHYGHPWPIDMHVWAVTSLEAVAKARSDFLADWENDQVRRRLVLRVTAVMQAAV